MAMARRRTSEHFQFLLELSDQLRIGILVHYSFVLDLLRLIGIAQRAQCFFVIGWRDCSYHGSFGIATKTIFQEPCKDLKEETLRKILHICGWYILKTYRITVGYKFLSFPLLSLLTLR